MTLSISVLVNDRKLLPCVCRHVGSDLDVLQRASLDGPSTGTADAASGTGHLGIGYYEQGEVLLARRPLTRESSLAGLLCRTPSNNLLAHVTARPKPNFRPVDAQPFRYKDWVWAQSGELRERADFDRRTLAVPSYLAGNIGTWQPAEVVFHLFLSFLHRTGTLGTLHWERPALRKALASAVSLVESSYVSPGGGKPDGYAIVASNGELVIAAGIGRAIALRRVAGIASCAPCAERHGVSQARRQIVDHPHVGAVIVSDLVPEGRPDWQVFESGVVVEVDAGLGVEHGPLPG